MMTSSEFYTIAVCTLGSNPQLEKLVEMLINIRKLSSIHFEILIVFNSEVHFTVNLRDVIIIHEPKLGFASVRNAALKWRRENSNLIFIDDDELPTNEWFANLIEMHSSFPEDIIVGPVYSANNVGNNLQSYRKQFENSYRSRTDGEILHQGATANMLIPANLFLSHDVYFDEFFDHSGSEDTDFCFRMRKKGCIVRYAKKAELFEYEESRKFDLSYLRKRHIRDIANYSVVIRRNSSWTIICYRGGTLLVRIGLYAIPAIAIPRIRTKFVAFCISFKSLIFGKLRI